MKQFRRIISLLLSFVLVLGMVPVTAAAEETVPEAAVIETTENYMIPEEIDGQESTTVPQEETKAGNETTAPEEESIPEETIVDEAVFLDADAVDIVAGGTCGENLTWTLDEQGHLLISGTGEMYNWDDTNTAPWFDYREYIQTVVLEDSVTSIGSWAFAECEYISEVDFSKSVTSLGEVAFLHCTGLTNITIPKTVTYLDVNPFAGCIKLKYIEVESGNEIYCSDEFGVVYTKDYSKLIAYPAGRTGNYSVNAKTNIIGGGAFHLCVGLTEIMLPENTTCIEHDAFASCMNIEKIIIPANVTKIDDYAFSGCEKLVEVVFIGSAPQFGQCLFSGITTTCLYPANDASWNEEVMQNYDGTITWIAYDEGDSPLCENGHDYDNNHECTRCDAIGGDLGSNATWILDPNGTLTISGSGDMQGVSFDYQPWEYHHDKIFNVIIEDGITSIGYAAFLFCRNMETVSIPDSVQVIYAEAFWGCSSLKEVVIPDGVTSIGDRTFYGCRELESVILPEGITRIGVNAFASCQALESIELPSTVTFIDEAAFLDCINLKTVNLPEELTELFCNNFYNCTSLEEITIPESVTRIYDGVFDNCTNLRKIIFTGNAPEFYNFTLNNVTATVYYPANDPTWTSDLMLDYGGDITWVSYKDGHIHEFGDDGKCTCGVIGGTCGENLIWTLDEAGTLTVSGSGAMYDYTIKTRPWYEYCDQIFEVVISAGVTRIGKSAFDSCDNIKKITLANTLETIGDSAFFQNDSLQEVVIPEGVTAIEQYAFQACDELSKVSLPSSLRSIGQSAFSGNWGLPSVEIPASVTFIGKNAFCGLEKATGIWVDPNNPNYCNDETGALFNKNMTTLMAFPGAYRGEYQIPDGVETISVNVFSSAGNLRKVTIPSTVKTAESCCFFCSDIEEFVFLGDAPAVGQQVLDGVTAKVYYPANNPTWTQTIMERMVEGPNGGKITWISYNDLSELYPSEPTPPTEPDEWPAHGICGDDLTWTLDEAGTLTVSGSGAMYDYTIKTRPWYEYCDQIFEVVISAGVTRIGKSAFDSCDNIKKITLANTLETIGDSAFFQNDSLQEVVIPEGVTAIEQYAFQACDELSKVSLPSSLRSIGQSAFSGNWGLPSVEIPASVTFIGKNAFCGLEKATGIWVDPNNPNYCNDETGALFNKNMTTLMAFPGAYRGEYQIPDGVETISVNVFSSAGNLRKVTIPSTVKTAESCCFFCSDIEEFVFLGDAPAVGQQVLDGVTAKVYYPANNPTWTQAIMERMVEGPNGGKITWIPYDELHVHDEVIDKGFAPTCTAIGLTEGKHCSVCGETIIAQQTVPATGHTEVIDDAVAPSCNETGLTEGKHCSVCGEVITAQQVISATGHIEVIDDAVAPSCNVTGLTEGKHCAACGEVITAQQTVPATGHTEVVDDAVAPSCNATGLTEGKHCSVCGEVITAQQTVPATGHTEVIDDAVAPTCTATGLTEGKHCQTCGTAILEQKVVPALGCAFTKYVSNEDATCIADGTKTATCDRGCGATDVITEEGSLNPNAHNLGEWVIQGNKQERVCSLCGYTESKVSTDGGDVEIEAPEQPDLDFDVDHVEPTDEQYILVEEALGGMEGTDQEILKVFDINLNNKDGVHVQPNGTVKVKLPLDWEKEGNYKVYRVNEDGTLTDMEAYQQGSHMVFETDHFSLYVIVEETVHVHEYRTEVTAPTCTEKGYTTYTCECGHTYIADKVPALGHREAVDTAVAATCTETGLTEGKHCSVCNTVLIERTVVPALGHTEVIDSAVPATCIRMGLTEGSHCSVCNTVLVEQKDTPLAEHTWNEGVITTDPTEIEPGVITYTCTVCGETRTEEIPCLEPALPSVQRVAGTSRADTALEVADALKEALGVEKFDTIILANGEDKNFADALTGSYLATVRKAPILMYRTSGLSPATKAYIQNNLVSGGTVYLLGGELAIPADVETELSAAGYEVLRLAGGSRFDTNLAILEEAGVGSKEILIARGFEFADSLSASATGLPILMVNEVTGKLTDSQIEFLKGLKGNKLTILGGTVAISETLQATIEGVVGREVDRVAGGSREATSVEIAKRYFDAPDFAVAAYSRRCPDGLCGGPLAYAMGAPLLLVNEGQERYANAYITEKEITSGYVLGGTLVITDKTARAVFGLADDAVIEMK